MPGKPIVLLDTSVLPRPGEWPPVFESLSVLGSEDTIHVLLPEVVLREWDGQWGEAWQKHRSRLINAIDKLSDYPRSGEMTDLRAAAERALPADKVNSEHPNVGDYMQAMSASVAKVSGLELRPMLDAYFVGDPPFSGRRSRNDIPDGLIYETVRAIAADAVGPVLFVAEDTGLREAVTSIEGVEVYESIGDMLADHPQWSEDADRWQQIAELFESDTKWQEALLPRLREALREHVKDIALDADLGLQSSESHVQGVSYVDTGQVEVKRVQSVGDGVFIVKFSAAYPADLNVFLSGPDRDEPPDARWVPSVQDERVRAHRIAHVRLELQGEVEFKLPELPHSDGPPADVGHVVVAWFGYYTAIGAVAPK